MTRKPPPAALGRGRGDASRIVEILESAQKRDRYLALSEHIDS